VQSVGEEKEEAIDKAVLQAVDCLKHGGIVAFPTETYYGLAVDPYNEKALEKLFRLKRRNFNKAILVLIGELGQLDMVALSIPNLYKPLMQKFWPGPLTLILPGRKDLSSLLTGGTGRIGIRLSSNYFATLFCKTSGRPITATSANRSGMIPAKSAEEVKIIFGSSVDYIFDGGVTPGGACSTVVGINDDGSLSLIREGQIAFSTIKDAL